MGMRISVGLVNPECGKYRDCGRVCPHFVPVKVRNQDNFYYSVREKKNSGENKGTVRNVRGLLDKIICDHVARVS